MSCNMLKLFFPMPPSTNRLYRNIGKGGRARTKEYDNWLKERLWEMSHIHKSQHIKGSVKLHFDFILGTSFRGDVSNRIKATEDALVKAGIIEDDNHRIVTGGSFTIKYHLMKQSFVEVTIQKLQEEMEI